MNKCKQMANKNIKHLIYGFVLLWKPKTSLLCPQHRTHDNYSWIQHSQKTVQNAYIYVKNDLKIAQQMVIRQEVQN